MRYLIDTNILIYIVIDKNLLDLSVRKIIENYENIIYVSSESVKEFIHLIQNERITPKNTFQVNNIVDFIESELGYTIKYVTQQHLTAFANLSVITNHNDPSDRLIISQAIAEKIPLISSNKKFELYRKYKLNFIFNEK